ncbi:protein Shroom1 isoform X2 [Cololabis saira]|uniref:protein Shroom1 isoform X2 n=1 Tax=Cololabis saira TaxID=129043 RepID=UPI002AD490BD|nr:protein Shroom1 isoform X2 [Cololabis saira]
MCIGGNFHSFIHKEHTCSSAHTRVPSFQTLPFPSCQSPQSFMDSYSFHFERMSNVDLHPLSLPVNRLSPAKSHSSIIDQLAHHQHGKGDSAYSSFSGGSTAPDYPSPFFPDDLQSSSFSHYADLKYMKSIYHPSQVLQSDPKTMDQLYRSVEAISQQYRNSTNVNHHSHNGNNSFHTNNKALSKQERYFGAASQNAHPPLHPPPIPARLDSFIATKNLENSRVHHHGTAFKSQQKQPRPHNHLHPRGLISPKPETANPDVSSASFISEPVYSVWKGPQQQPQGQHPPSYRPHLQPHDEARGNPEYLFITDKNAGSEQHKSQSPPRGKSKSEHSTSKKSSIIKCNGDHHNKPGSGSLFENQRKRSHSAHDLLDPEPARAASPWTNQGLISGSIQQKGQFYFVTGVCKLSECGFRTQSSSVSGSEAGSEVSSVRDKERCHSTMDNLFKPLQESSRSSSGTISVDRDTLTSASNGKDLISKSQDQENHRPLPISLPSAQTFNTDVMESPEIGRHTASNPIFYCGPDRKSPPYSATNKKEVSSLISNEQPNHNKREEHAKRGKRQPLGDVASERINKETTPLLYHLTGANWTAMQPKNDPGFSKKDKEGELKKTGQVDVAVNDKERPASDDNKSNTEEVASSACNTLDDSYKKYYKEKLKDAQCKVLRETSFKRRDLQLSLPHRGRQKPDPRPPMIHSFSSSQDSETSTETLALSLTSEETEKGSIKLEENHMEVDRETERESGKPVNVAQPQVGRIGGRKRLTLEQKKMCYSEPEKLHQLGAPSHSTCRSFGSESESPFAAAFDGGEHVVEQGEQGLVAARRRMFETRGRALSASCTIKTNLKHLQHKALVEYMERKTGQKAAEPQQPTPQLPPPPRQRHSLGEKPFDWGPRPLSGNHDSRNSKKKLHRPHSAGRILDSSSSSIRYAQFFSAQSCSGQYPSKQSPCRLSRGPGPSQGKAASVESLLDPPETPSFLRNRSTSTPHSFQAHDDEEDQLPVNSMETWSSQKSPVQESSVKAVPKGQQQRVRVVAQRGKSMEELGGSKLTKMCAHSKSSEHLDQWRHSNGPGRHDRDKARAAFFTDVREARWQESGRRKQVAKEAELAGQKNTQGQTQNQTQRRAVLKPGSVPGEDAPAGGRSASGSNSPPSNSSIRNGVHAASPDSHGPVTDELRSDRKPSETGSNPAPFRGQEIRPSSSTPTPTKPACENTTCSRSATSVHVSGPEKEQAVDEPGSDGQPPDSSPEVPLSGGVTSDASPWPLPPGEEESFPLTDDVFEESASPVLPKQTSETSPCTSVSDADVSPHTDEQKDEQKDSQVEAEGSGDEDLVEERGTAEGETQRSDRPDQKPQWEELVEAVVQADPSLAQVLYPLANRKTALMLMEQLLSEDTLLMEEHYKKKQEQKESAESGEPVEGPEPSSGPADGQNPQSTDPESKADVTEKKRLLVSCIEERLRSLEESRGALQIDVEENSARGAALEVLVRERCLPVELERYNLFIGDLERVVNLLLCLSARLARVQNALSTVDQHTDAEDKESLDSRHRLLCKQREDAKDLKDNLDRRENLVSTFLSRQLSAEQLQEYRRFVQTKASLLIRHKDLEEKQRLGEEQLEAVSSSRKNI